MEITKNTETKVCSWVKQYIINYELKGDEFANIGEITPVLVSLTTLNHMQCYTYVVSCCPQKEYKVIIPSTTSESETDSITLEVYERVDAVSLCNIRR